MRGKVSSFSMMAASVRITPAYAGKRHSDNLQRRRIGDHPRVCGEKCPFLRQVLYHGGSPPRMRGKVYDYWYSVSCGGITPAYAGKRRFCFLVSVPDRDHPRVCGEKCGTISSTSWEKGSPPRMRGKATFSRCCALAVGITPAYAGKRRKAW